MQVEGQSETTNMRRVGGYEYELSFDRARTANLAGARAAQPELPARGRRAPLTARRRAVRREVGNRQPAKRDD